MIPEKSRSTWGPWLLFGVGLLIYVGVQGYMMVTPLRHWTLTPEIDDTLTYVLKSQQMLECFQQNCPALNDLRDQLFSRGDVSANSEAFKQRVLTVSRVFPVYHPLFSALLIGLSKLGMQGNLMEAYRFLWSLAPLIFGVAFAYWLATMFNPAVAGVALMLLAFKVYPDTGLSLLVPSNLTMALAVVLWARIISSRGWAPWSLVLGTLVLVTMHLIGVIYAAMAVALSLLLADQEHRKRLLLAVGAVAVFLAGALLVARLVKRPDFVLPPLLPSGGHPLLKIFQGTAANALRVIVDNVRLSDGLWGSPAIFCGAVVLGWLVLKPASRRVVARMLLIYGLVLGGFMFYASNHPADILFRLWIPLVVLLFGLVAQAICFGVDASKGRWRDQRQAPPDQGSFDLKRFWPLILLAVLLGYSGQMIARGAEQVQVMATYLREKEPLVFYPSQPKDLLAHAHPGDRVLYTSYMVMDYYLINGALRLGAVYYNPALQGTWTTSRWLVRPDLRFAVAFQPTVYHPSFEGKDESDWWPSMPDFRYSLLNRRRGHEPLAREGKIPAALYHYVDVKATTPNAPKTLRLNIDNPQGSRVIDIVPLDQEGKPLDQYRQVLDVPAHHSGWLTVDLTKLPVGAAIRLVFPHDSGKLQISGLTFGEDRLHWPWSQKALMSFQYRNECNGPITVSFDPAALLPQQLRGRQITVMDDRGSSVLMKLQK
uniref:Glycosyltransferase RgtA/B/C/D-like domain-containing protein n=1 Tax=Desulfobacca acetoxidans TaxID=60893 RepID=A0A7V6DQ22_9BACT